MELTGFVIIHVFITSFSPAQGERNQMVNAKFTRPVNVMPMSTVDPFPLPEQTSYLRSPRGSGIPHLPSLLSSADDRPSGRA